MKLANSVKQLVVMSLMLMCLFGSAGAAVINYQVTNLDDIVPGEDLWQYAYTVSDHTFNTDFGFTIYFDLELYSSIEDPPLTVNNHWDILTFQPDPRLLADGMYDALALADNARLTDPFVVSFIWLGTGSPGEQPFDLYELQDAETLNTLGSGMTSAVPIPGTILLFGSGLVGLVGYRKRRSAASNQ